MDESIQTDSNRKILDRYSHLFISVSSVDDLNELSMCSLFLKFKIHQNLASINSRVVWCHSSEARFDYGFMVPIVSLSKISLENLEISIELLSKHIRSTTFIGSCKTPVFKFNESNEKKEILYIFKQKSFPLLSNDSATVVGNITCTAAFANIDQTANVIPPLTFELASVHYINTRKKETNEKHNSVTYIDENIEAFSKLNCSPTSNKFIQCTEIISIKPSPAKSEDEWNGKNIQLSPTKNFQISKTQPILSPCTTPLKEIDSILDEDIDTENIIDRFMQKKMIQGFGRHETPKTPKGRTANRRQCKLRKNSSLERILHQNQFSLELSSSESDDLIDTFK